MSVRALQIISVLLVFGVLVYVLEGCAGQYKPERHEKCTTPSHEYCRDVEEFKTCMYDYYLDCIKHPVGVNHVSR